MDWQLVPKQPTPDMMRAGADSQGGKFDWSGITNAAYDAMLAAAPAPTEWIEKAMFLAIEYASAHAANLSLLRNLADYPVELHAEKKQWASEWHTKAKATLFAHLSSVAPQEKPR